MPEEELNILADKIALKMEHITCPLGMDADAVKAAQMLGAAHREVKPGQSSYVLVLRLGDELTGFGIRLLHWVVICIAIMAIVLLGMFALPHLARLINLEM